MTFMADYRALWAAPLKAFSQDRGGVFWTVSGGKDLSAHENASSSRSGCCRQVTSSEVHITCGFQQRITSGPVLLSMIRARIPDFSNVSARADK